MAAYDMNPNQAVDGRSNTERVDELMAHFNYLRGLRGNWNSHWTEIAERIYPMHRNLFESFGDTTQGEKRNQEVFDSTGIIALQRFGAIMDSLLTPRNQFWSELVPSNRGLMKDKETRMWFEDTNQKLFEFRYSPSANFSSQNQLQYLSLGAYGTGGLFIDDLPSGKGIRYRNIHLSQLFLQENHQGLIDQVCRYFPLTARQACQQFGAATPKRIRERAEKFPEDFFWFTHWVKPNNDLDMTRKDWRGMSWTSEYVCTDTRDLLAQGGYRSFPYALSRYEQAPMEAYGRSIAMDVLPSIKTLNEQKKTALKQGHRATDPVLLVHDDGIMDSLSLEPGTAVPGGISKDGRLLVQPLPTGNFQVSEKMMEEEKSLINDSFLSSIFQILTENPEMTATEVMERTREKGILLAPTVGRQQSEYLGPMIDRELDILNRQGLLRPLPQLLKRNRNRYKTEYDSPITRSQKADRVAGAMRSMEFLGNYANTAQDPSALDLIDIDVAGPEICDANGMPAKWIRAPGDIAKIRANRQQAQQQQTAIQAAPAAAGIMKAQAQSGGGGGQPQG